MQSPNRIVTDLGFDTRDRYRLGAWFTVPESAVRRVDSGDYFAPAKAKDGRGGRRVIEASPYGPNMVFFARSASISSDYDHKAHDHRSDYEACQIDKDGWIARKVPVTVDAQELALENWSCVEPDTSGLYAQIERWLRS